MQQGGQECYNGLQHGALSRGLEKMFQTNGVMHSVGRVLCIRVETQSMEKTTLAEKGHSTHRYWSTLANMRSRPNGG